MTDPDRTALAPFLQRLLLHSPLGTEERRAVLALPYEVVHAAGRTDLVSPGQTVDHAILVASGMLGRFDLMGSGTRQVTAVYIAGDMCDLHSVVAPTTGWGIVAFTGSTVLHVPHAALKAAARRYPSLALAFWRDTTLDASVLAKWIAIVGRKDARARIAHLLCEMGIRSERAGLGRQNDYPLELRQEQIGDSMGLTPVHVNRTLQSLREDGLIAFQNRHVEILDWDGLTAVAEFSATYLRCGEWAEAED